MASLQAPLPSLCFAKEATSFGSGRHVTAFHLTASRWLLSFSFLSRHLPYVAFSISITSNPFLSQGDSRDDFLFVDSINGSTIAWLNGGQIQSSGSAFQWNWQGVVASGGFTRGECTEFGELYGLGRADTIGGLFTQASLDKGTDSRQRSNLPPTRHGRGCKYMFRHGDVGTGH